MKKLEEWQKMREERELAWKALEEKHSSSRRKRKKRKKKLTKEERKERKILEKQKRADAKKKAEAKEKEEWAKEKIRDVPYKVYIVSRIWKERRDRMVESQCKKCEICNSTENLNVHHNNYKTRGEEEDTDLIVVCRSCHKEFHKINIVARDKNTRRFIHGVYDSMYTHTTVFVQPHEHRCCMCAWKPVVCISAKEEKVRSLKFCIDCYELFLPKMEKAPHLCMETIQKYTSQPGLREAMSRFGF